MQEVTKMDVITRIDRINSQIFRNPNKPDAYLGLVECYKELKLYPAAIRTLGFLLILQPENQILYRKLKELIESASNDG